MFATRMGMCPIFSATNFSPSTQDFRGAVATGDYFTQQSCAGLFRGLFVASIGKPRGPRGYSLEREAIREVFGNLSGSIDVTAVCEAETATGRKPPFLLSAQSGRAQVYREISSDSILTSMVLRNPFFRWPRVWLK